MEVKEAEHHSETSKGTEQVLDEEAQRQEAERSAKSAHASLQRSFLCAIFFCLPLGITAWIYSVKARDSLARGDHLEHSKWLKKSNFFLKCAYQVGLLVTIFFFGGILTGIILLLSSKAM